MWRPKDPLKIIPLSNGYYIVSFSNKEHRDYAFQEGPWMIEDHYLIVQRWRPNFNPWKVDLQCHIAAWIRLPNVPFEFYNVESLRRIGNMIGKMIKVDRTTSIYDKGGFACICVEIDLQKTFAPILHGVWGGAIDHLRREPGLEVNDAVNLKTGKEVGGGATIVIGDVNADASPFGKIQILRREIHGPSSSA
ncbi:hypothetical protein K1719_009742 [Acacia pycnantha]|nr:hypothetical protein K1719_009742 [Acacia pycnantha]